MMPPTAAAGRPEGAADFKRKAEETKESTLIEPTGPRPESRNDGAHLSPLIAERKPFAGFADRDDNSE